MFKRFGYFKEYYIWNKLIGFLICQKDRDVYGFFGRKIEKIDNDIILSNNKKIKHSANKCGRLAALTIASICVGWKRKINFTRL